MLLFAVVDPSRPERPRYWFPVGGGLEDGETLEEAAIREVEEETGLRLTNLGPPVLSRTARFEFDEVSYEQDETYFASRVRGFTPSSAGWTDIERRSVVDHRWWSAAALRATLEVVFPEGLAELVDRLTSEVERSPLPNGELREGPHRNR